MLIRVKERGWNKKNRKNKERERETIERDTNEEETQALGNLLA